MNSAISLNPHFKDTLECPICYEFFTPPVFICSNGHSICSLCKDQSKTCPVCRGSYASGSRNTVIESMLEQLSVVCKYEGCGVSVSLGQRQEHYRVCPFNNLVKCWICGSYEEDLVPHLIGRHDYKEITMDESGGNRSFSGPHDSWIRDTEWPKGIWRFGSEATIVHAKTKQGLFHVYLYRISKSPMHISISISSGDDSLECRGKVPHVSELQEKANPPHFNCDVSVILAHYVKIQEEDAEILRLWVTVERLEE
jgi:E3 ubiquitin-protein ligase SIAH1